MKSRIGFTLKHSINPGFTLIEVILAIAMLAILSATFLPIMSWLAVRSKMFQYDSQAGLVLQKGMEVTYNVLITDWDINWLKYPAGIYHPAIETGVDSSYWVLIPGSETNLETRYERKIEIKPVCRNPDDGEISLIYPCNGINIEDDKSKIVNTTVEWKEGAKVKVISAKLLITYLGN